METIVYLSFRQAVLLAGIIVKILPSRAETTQRKFEFEDPPNQELNKKNRSQRKAYLKNLVPK